MSTVDGSRLHSHQVTLARPAERKPSLLRAVLWAFDRWLGRRSMGVAVAAMTWFAMAASTASGMALYLSLYHYVPRGMLLVNATISMIVAGPFIYYAQRVIRSLIKTKRELSLLTEQLVAARDMADGANRAKSAFLTNMRHELRTPLNVIIGFSDMLVDTTTPKGDEATEYAREIQSSGQRLLGTLNDILDIVALESGQSDMLDETMDILDLLRSIVRSLTAQAAQRNVNIVAPTATIMPDLLGCERLVRQMLSNVLSNAIKFTPDGGEVTVSLHWRPGTDMTIRVADTGIGMTKDEIGRALSLFGQADNSLARPNQGAGLGLPLAKSMIGLHGGEMVIASEPGKGTRVSLVFPAERLIEPIRQAIA